MNRIDSIIHELYKCFEDKGIKWNDFHGVGVDEDYYDYYYAENQLYIIRDRVMEKYWFVKARSPVEALKGYEELCRDIGMAMAGEQDG